jgi:AraC-like DNA-binding protein
MSYREHAPPAGLADVVACTWEQHVPADADGRVQRVVPDACVDVVWFAGAEEPFVAGPDTAAALARLRPGTSVFGVRLRPGAAGAVLGVHVAALRDARPGLSALWRDEAKRLGAALTATGSSADRRALLLAAVAARRARPDGLVVQAAHLLDAPDARVGALPEQLFVSERQLRRRVEAAVGYGPKTLARVLRFQRLRRLTDLPLVDAALVAGYADQAHMTTEVTKLAGVPPVRFLKDDGGGGA